MPRRVGEQQFFFVNDRFIKSPYLNHAVSSAFDGLTKNGVYPGYFLFLEVDPQSIDINIHPTKTEIKFDDEHAIYAMLRATIKHSLGQFSIAPVLDFNKENGFDTPYEYSKKTPKTPTIEVDRDFNPFKEGGTFIKKPTPFSSFKKETAPSWEALYTTQQENIETITPPLVAGFETENETGSLFSDMEKTSQQLTFQLQNKYIVSAIKSGMLVIHQNLAHQRILYEELLKNITVQEAVSQQLLFPLQFQFSKPKMALLVSVKEQLEHTGFVFSIMKEDNMEITGIPSNVMESSIEGILEQLLLDIENEVPDSGFSQNDLLAKSLAKSLAVKTGTSMSKEEQEHLIHQLFACKEPSVSPENKKVVLTLEATDFDKKFI